VRTALEKLKRLQLENDAATRQSLISRLHRLNDCDSWSSFFELYWRLIYGTARDAGLSNEECEDVVQETVISVAKAMPEFHYNRQNGSFRSWLFQLTRWRIKDQIRRRGRLALVPYESSKDVEMEDDAPPEIEESAVPPELEEKWNEEWEANLLYAAVERVRRRHDPKQFQIFELTVIKEWPANKARRFLRVSRPTMYAARYRVRKAIIKEIEELRHRCS